ncbi:MAG TPA: glutamate racemase [Spirochaetota bacterium]|nr:glutamate racemase [Spirochaetota bacterium]HPI87947.1 glutamate racemase [Spirochaetota bacterium]HPR46657.1 glutamate racemase [Spirochaetota bacterium]
MSEQPIGIFDSGIGGLTVCKAINELLPGENIIYFGDTARFPYGTRSVETIIRYSREISSYLLSRDVKMIVIACNTSSAAALETLQNDLPVPVIGVIDAGARAACARHHSGPVGVIGTRATVTSGSYVRAITSVKAGMEVLQQQATLFVTITEEGMIDTDIARLAAREYIQGMYDRGMRTLILGCTHFPLLKKAIQDVYPDLDLVDTGIEIAHEVKSMLHKKNLENKTNPGHIGSIELYASDITDTLERLKNMFFFKNGTVIEKLIISG